MIKLVAMFKRPEDVEAFRQHYNDVHSPLMQKVPGLQRMEVIRDIKAFGGEPAYFQITEMYFPDEETFRSAMSSPENRAAGKDLMSFARDVVTMVYGEVSE